MRWTVGRFVRGVIDEDVDDPERSRIVDAVFDRDRLAVALKEVTSGDDSADDVS